MTLSNDLKPEVELTCCFKIDIRDFSNLDSRTQKSEHLHFIGLLSAKVYNSWARKTIEELCLIAMKIDAKFQRKLTGAFENDTNNLADFNLQVPKERFHFRK